MFTDICTMRMSQIDWCALSTVPIEPRNAGNAMRVLSKLETLLYHLVDLACARLADLYDDERHLFAYRFREGQIEPTPIAWTIVYTAISLLGIAKAQHHGRVFDWLDCDAALDSLISLRRHASRAGDVGLILWTDVLFGGHHADVLIAEIGTLANAAAIRTLSTMEVAWILTGLCSLRQLRPFNEGLPALGEQFYQALVGRQIARTGLFCHGQSRAAVEWYRNGIGSFADQVYSIFALATCFETDHNPAALEHARQCCDRIRELQGGQGQWWWHYDAPRGVVAARYPVYSVHQDGMAPMALMKLTSVAGDDYAQGV